MPITGWRLRQRSKHEIVCMCDAYGHPHRLGGGGCNGGAWCYAFRTIDSYECINCNYNNNGQCDVITGAETISEQCECVADELRTRSLEDTYGYLPLDIVNYWEKLEVDYYEHRE